MAGLAKKRASVRNPTNTLLTHPLNPPSSNPHQLYCCLRTLSSGVSMAGLAKKRASVRRLSIMEMDMAEERERR